MEKFDKEIRKQVRGRRDKREKKKKVKQREKRDRATESVGKK